MARRKKPRKAPSPAAAHPPSEGAFPGLDAPPAGLQLEIPAAAHAFIPLVFVAVAAALRFSDLGAKGLWFDEVRTLTDTAFTPARTDPHWMFFLITRRFLPLAADETVGVRLYPALAGTLAPAVIYLFVSRLWSRLAGLFAALIACFQPFSIFYSQEGRYYAPMMLFSALSLLLIFVFAQTAARWRYALLPAWGALAWVSFGNHPTSAPFMGAEAMALAAAPLVTAWGFDAVLAAVPPLRRARQPRLILAGAATAAAILGAIALPGQFGRAAQMLLRGPWGETPGVDFSWAFLAQHLREFGWDLKEIPTLGAATAILNLAAGAAGFAVLARRRPFFAAMFGWLGAATFLAVFAYQTKAAYLAKYVAFLQPIFVALLGVAAASLLEAALRARLSSRPLGWAAAAGCAAILVLGQTPGLMRYYREYKMPVRSQMEWLNDHEQEGADLYIYGHGGYCAAFYANRLAPRHRIRYFPWAEDSGDLEIEMLKGAGTHNRPAYFAYCWPEDMPANLNKWLRAEAAVMARFPSVLGEEFGGVLYRIPPKADPRHRGPKRPAPAIDEIASIGRPSIVPDPQSGDPALRFLQQSTVRYRYPFRAGDSYLFEIDLVSPAARPQFVSVFPGAEEPRILGGGLVANRRETLRCFLEPKANASELNLRYASEYQEYTGDEAGLIVREIRIRPREEGAPDYALEGYVPFAPLQPFILGGAGAEGRGWDWQVYPPDTVQVDQNPNGEYAVVHAPMSLHLSSLVSPGLTAAPASLVHVRGRIRMNGAYGVVATMTTLFLGEDGKRLGNPTMSSAHLISRLGWENWIERLIPAQWHEFETVRISPDIPSRIGATALIWKSTWAKRHPEAPNEVHLQAPEISIVELAPLAGQSPSRNGAPR